MAFRSRKTGRTSGYKLLLFTVLLIFFVIHIRIAFLDQLAIVGGTTREHFAHWQKDPDALSSLAKTAYIRNDDSERALTLYRRALGSLSVHIPAWIGLAEVEADLGEGEKAVLISNYIDAISPDSRQWRWARTMLAYTLEQNSLLANNLSWFIENNFGKREQALALATSVWPDLDELLLNIGVKSSPHLLHYYIKQKEVEKVKLIWQIVLQNDLAEEINTLRLVIFFINNGEIEAGSAIWERFFKTDDTLLTNGAFENELAGSGFGWRLTKALRRLLSRQDGGLAITFSGTENVGFNLHQLVTITPGMTYSLSASQKGKDLTTDQKPFWTVSSYKCEKFYHKSSMDNSRTDWQDFALTFTVPGSCEAVWIAVRRNKSYHFDNRISGEFSFKNLSLIQIAGYDAAAGTLQN